MKKIVLANHLYVPEEYTSEAAVAEVYETHTFCEASCRKCPVFKKNERPNAVCFQCSSDFPRTKEHPFSRDGYTGLLQQWRRVTIKGNDYFALPSGNVREALQTLKLDHRLIADARSRVPMDVTISFTGKLYTGRELVSGKRMANQVGILKQFWNTPSRSGIIVAPPRTGKTVLGAALACAYGLKTLIIAHESIMLDQFEKEIRRFTDIDDQERVCGRKLMVIAKREKDLSLDVDILLINYQKLITDLGIRRVTRHLQKHYGLLMVDEIHRCSTEHYRALLDRLDPAYRVGFSATPRRKDGREQVFLRSLGPIQVIAKVDTLKPTIHIHPTGLEPPVYRGRQAYTKTCGWLADSLDRNKQLVKQIFADLRENPKNVLVLPVIKIIHAKTLVEMINRQAKYNNEHRDEDWPEDIAVMLWRESDKQQVIADVSARRQRVLVAIQKFVREGTNIPALSHYYQVFPQNNDVSTEQGTARILTPLDDKPDPLIRYWVEEEPISVSCLRNTYHDSFIRLGYTIAPDSQDTLRTLINMTFDRKSRRKIDPATQDVLSLWGKTQGTTLPSPQKKRRVDKPLRVQ